MRRFRNVRDDRGDTLIEVVMAVLILGIAAVAIVGGMALSVKVSDIHRKQADAGAALHDYAESLQSSYNPCHGSIPAAYRLSAEAGFRPPDITVRYWTGESFSPTCPGADPGLQQLTIDVTSTDGRASESLTVVVRRP